MLSPVITLSVLFSFSSYVCCMRMHACVHTRVKAQDWSWEPPWLSVLFIEAVSSVEPRFSVWLAGLASLLGGFPISTF